MLLKKLLPELLISICECFGMCLVFDLLRLLESGTDEISDTFTSANEPLSLVAAVLSRIVFLVKLSLMIDCL